MLTDDELKAITERAEAATPGPWRSQEYFWGIEDTNHNIIVHSLGDGQRAKKQANQDFIAHSSTDIPALLSDVRELKAEVERLKAALFEVGEKIEAEWYGRALDDIDAALKGGEYV